MPSLQVRELPDPIYRKLSEMASKQHRSLAQQAIMLLAKSLNIDMSTRARRKQLLDEIRSHASELKKFKLSDPAKLLREERNR